MQTKSKKVSEVRYTRHPKALPNWILPISPINTLAFGIFRGRKPRQAKEILIATMPDEVGP
jgi:hypothetical protein